MDKQIRKNIKKIADKQVRATIEEIIGHMQCPKGFKCAQGGFEDLCRAQECGMEYYLECLEEKPRSCKFVILFGDRHYCQCPLRVYIAKHLGK